MSTVILENLCLGEVSHDNGSVVEDGTSEGEQDGARRVLYLPRNS